MRRLALIAALIVLAATPARAAEPVPGSSCAGQNANSFTWSGASQNGGVVNGMFCNGGTNLYTSAVNFQSTGYVGIGTASPTNLLTIGAGGFNDHPRQAIEILEQGYSNPGADAAYSNGDKLVMWNNSGNKANIGIGYYSLWFQASGNAQDNIEFWTGSTAGVAPTERMRIDSAGNVGIGTTSPAATLDVEASGGANVTVGGTAGLAAPTGTTYAVLTADFTDASAAGLQAITGLSFTLPASVAQNIPFECNLMYSQATMVSDSFGIGLITYAPTRIDAHGLINTAAAGTQASAALTNLTTTTPTAIVSGTPGVTNVVYSVILAGLVQNASNAGTNTLNFYVSQATAADVVKVKAGSWCKIW